MKTPARNAHRRQGGEVSGMEGAGILSELHPVAAGVYNTAVFVIIPHRQRGGLL